MQFQFPTINPNTDGNGTDVLTDDELLKAIVAAAHSTPKNVSLVSCVSSFFRLFLTTPSVVVMFVWSFGFRVMNPDTRVSNRSSLRMITTCEVETRWYVFRFASPLVYLANLFYVASGPFLFPLFSDFCFFFPFSFSLPPLSDFCFCFSLSPLSDFYFSPPSSSVSLILCVTPLPPSPPFYMPWTFASDISIFSSSHVTHTDARLYRTITLSVGQPLSTGMLSWLSLPLPALPPRRRSPLPFPFFFSPLLCRTNRHI